MRRTLLVEETAHKALHNETLLFDAIREPESELSVTHAQGQGDDQGDEEKRSKSSVHDGFLRITNWSDVGRDK